MSERPSPAEVAKRNWLFMKRNWLFIFAGLGICGLLGDFVAGPDGRNLGGGIGFAIGMIVAWIASKIRSERDQTKTPRETELIDARESPS